MSNIYYLLKTHYFKMRIAFSFVYLIFICNSSQAQWSANKWATLVVRNKLFGRKRKCFSFRSYTGDATWWAQLFSFTDSGNTLDSCIRCEIYYILQEGSFHDTLHFTFVLGYRHIYSNDDGLNWYNSTSALANHKFMMQQFAMINFCM
ncbi:MAG: hypothetical protein IPL22_16695 [Bacteroidetes bacterium]|nr:hypothetical protein [Bacteroidota bacterium]